MAESFLETLCTIKTSVMWTYTLDESLKGTLHWYVHTALAHFLWTLACEHERGEGTETGEWYMWSSRSRLCAGAVGYTGQNSTGLQLDSTAIDLRPDPGIGQRQALCFQIWPLFNALGVHTLSCEGFCQWTWSWNAECPPKCLKIITLSGVYIYF